MAGTLRVTLRYGVQGMNGEHLGAGETHALPDRFARELVNTGRAVYAPDQAEPPVVPLTVSGKITDADPVVNHRDPVGRARGRK